MDKLDDLIKESAEAREGFEETVLPIPSGFSPEDEEESLGELGIVHYEGCTWRSDRTDANLYVLLFTFDMAGLTVGIRVEFIPCEGGYGYD